jgi:hypothetical protein
MLWMREPTDECYRLERARYEVDCQGISGSPGQCIPGWAGFSVGAWRGWPTGPRGRGRVRIRLDCLKPSFQKMEVHIAGRTSEPSPRPLIT